MDRYFHVHSLASVINCACLHIQKTPDIKTELTAQVSNLISNSFCLLLPIIKNRQLPRWGSPASSFGESNHSNFVVITVRVFWQDHIFINHSTFRFSGEKRPWTPEGKKAVLSQLGRYVASGIVPGKKACEECIRKSQGALSKRGWTGIKFFVKNEIHRRKWKIIEK